MPVLHDLRLALRMLAKSPLSNLLAVATLAVGIGANTAIFSILNAALLKLLPVPHPNELVMLTDPNASMVLGGMVAGARSLLGYQEFTRLRDRTRTMSGVCASQLRLESLPLRIGNGPREQARSRLVSENYFAVFGVQPALGRLFTARDATAIGKDPYAVISYDYWQQRFGGRSSIVGATIRIHHASLLIIGIAPRGFHGETVGQDPDLWLPLLMQPFVMPGWDGLRDFMGQSQDKLMWLHVFGRRKPGFTNAQVQAEINVLFRQILAADYPASMPPDMRKEALAQYIHIQPVRSGAFHGREEFAREWSILAALAALVLLVACANIANLLLARAAGRAREIAIRLSLGASKAALLRQFLVESLVLASLGSIAGVSLAVFASRALALLLQTSSHSFEIDPQIDRHVLAFTVATGLLVGILSGLVPAPRVFHGALSEDLKGRDRSHTASRRHTRIARTLVIAQLALSFLLVLGSALFLATLHNLQTVSLGYPKENILLVEIDSSASSLPPVSLDHALAARLRAVPGVRSVTYSDRPLFNGFDGAFAITVQGFTSSAEKDRGSAGSFVAPAYFSTIGIPMLIGRPIELTDGPSSPRVCVINEAFAKHFFAGRNPVGLHLAISSASMQIVGVARNVRTNSLRGSVEPKFYAAADQDANGAFSFEIRAFNHPARLANPVRRTILSFSPNLSLSHLQTLDEKITDQNAQPRLIADLCTAFGAIALFLAAIGIYAVLSANVSRRTGEFGIRMALGAPKRRITGMVLKQTGWMIVAGLLAGIAASAALARLLSAELYGAAATAPRWSLARYEHVESATQLYGIGVFDPSTIAATICLLAAVALLAAYIPAARAAHVDPASALRRE